MDGWQCLKPVATLQSTFLGELWFLISRIDLQIRVPVMLWRYNARRELAESWVPILITVAHWLVAIQPYTHAMNDSCLRAPLRYPIYLSMRDARRSWRLSLDYICADVSDPITDRAIVWRQMQRGNSDCMEGESSCLWLMHRRNSYLEFNSTWKLQLQKCHEMSLTARRTSIPTWRNNRVYTKEHGIQLTCAVNQWAPSLHWRHYYK